VTDSTKACKEATRLYDVFTATTREFLHTQTLATRTIEDIQAKEAVRVELHRARTALWLHVRAHKCSKANQLAGGQSTSAKAVERNRQRARTMLSKPIHNPLRSALIESGWTVSGSVK